MLSIVMVLIVVVVVVKRKAACKQKKDVIVNGNSYYNNTVVVLQGLEMLEQGVGADYNDAHSCQGVGNNQQGEDKDLLNFDVGYNPYEVVNREVLGKNTMTPTQKECYQGKCCVRGQRRRQKMRLLLQAKLICMPRQWQRRLR